MGRFEDAKDCFDSSEIVEIGNFVILEISFDFLSSFDFALNRESSDSGLKRMIFFSGRAGVFWAELDSILEGMFGFNWSFCSCGDFTIGFDEGCVGLNNDESNEGFFSVGF